MREHQININLKAQQFELLQKLAREKGYKSVSAYVREKIMELAFASEPQDAGGERAGNSIAMDGEVIKELSRIHDEMQQFIKESLGLGADAPLPYGLSTEMAHNEQAASQSERLNPQLNAASDAFDLALGLGGNQPISVVPPFDVNSLADDLSFLAGTAPAAESFYPDQYQSPSAAASDLPDVDVRSANQAAADAFFNTGGRSGSESIVSESNQAIFSSNNNLGGFAYNMGNYASFGGNSFVTRFGAPGDGTTDRLSDYKEILDDLEELADRAFAISPRLGSLTEEASSDTSPDAGSDASPANSRAANTAEGRHGSSDSKAPGDAGAGRRASHQSSAQSPPQSPARAEKPQIAAPEPTNFAAPAPPPEISAPLPSAQSAPAAPLAPVSFGTQALSAAQGAPPPPAELTVAPVNSTAQHQPVRDEVQPATDFDPLMAAEDDLLDDLLDGDLLAQAHAPRENNPFAVDLPFGNGDSAPPSDLQNFGPLDAEDDGPAPDPAQVELDQIMSVPEATQEDEQASALVPSMPVSTETVQTADPTLPDPAAASGGDLTTAATQNQSDSQEEPPGYFQGESQDANSMGLSGLSGGPPPKRRRT